MGQGVRPQAPWRAFLNIHLNSHLIYAAFLSETGKAGFTDSDRELWFRGEFPRSYLAGSVEASYTWLLNFTRTFLERDISRDGLYHRYGAGRQVMDYAGPQ